MGTKEENLERLEKISKFEYDWNGYEAESFDDQYINMVKEIIESLEIQPELVPTGRSTVDLYFSTDNEYLGIEIGDTKSEFVYVPQDSGNKRYDKAIEGTVQNKYINLFVKKMLAI